MDTTFENITPWNGSNDTGLDVRKKWERNFDKVKQNFAELSDLFEKVNIGTASVPVYAIRVKYDFFSLGAISAYGPSASSSSGSGGVDETTLWSIMGNTGTQQIAANHLATALSPYVTQSAMSAALINYAPINHGHVWGDITDRPSSLPASDVYAWAKAAMKPSYSYSEITDKPTSLPASDVYAWAKAISKPSYAFSEITDKPSTLGGYGITDAMTAGNINNLVTSSIGAVQIGGTNLLTQSKGKFQPNAGVIDNFAVYSNTTVYLENGKTYTISGKTNGIFTNTHNRSVESDNCVLWILKEDFSTYTIVSSSTTGTTGTIFIWNYPTGTYCLRVNGYHADGSTYAEEIKIENGNKATSWSPAPGDKLNAWDNAVSATKLYNPRSFTIGNTAKSFDGTGNVSWSLSEIGAAAAIHSHTISQITDIANASVNYAASAGNATKLQTVRSIFGQNFDGTGDVNGTVFTNTGLKSRNICIETDSDGNASSRGSEINNWNGNLYLQHASSKNLFCCMGGGYVGIGTTSPAYKLHVSGTGYFSDSLNLAATLSAAGLINANGNIKTNNYIEIGSTGIRIMYDSTNDCLKLIKSDGSAVNLLVTGGVTALATA